MLFAGLWATPACATPYVGVSAGLGLLNNSDGKDANGSQKDVVEYNTGVPFGIAVGVKSDCYRLEGAVGYQSHSVDRAWDGRAMVAATNTDVSIWSFMANGYYDICMKDSGVSPYLTAGLGFASVKAKDHSDTFVDDSVFAWQVGAGVGLKASENVVVDLGYRYFRTSDVTTNDHTDLSIAGSNILAGIRYSF